MKKKILLKHAVFKKTCNLSGQLFMRMENRYYDCGVMESEEIP